VIFKLTVTVFYLFFRFFEILRKLFHPFGDYSENPCRFYKKYAILNFFLGIFWSIFGNFSTDNEFGIALNLFFIIEIFLMSNVFVSGGFSFSNWYKYLLKDIFHKRMKSFKLFIRFINHIVYNSHDLRSVIFILFIAKRYSTSTNDIVFDSTLIIDLRNERSKSHIRRFYFGLWVLLT
jgi:hypothetical protein